MLNIVKHLTNYFLLYIMTAPIPGSLLCVLKLRQIMLLRKHKTIHPEGLLKSEIFKNQLYLYSYEVLTLSKSDKLMSPSKKNFTISTHVLISLCGMSAIQVAVTIELIRY